MKLTELIEGLELEVISSPVNDQILVEKGYVSDLLSDVIANAEKDTIWITMQTHVNIIAVAALKELGALIIVNSREPEPDTIRMAKEKGVCVLGTNMTAFETAGKLYGKGIKG
ncbi:MAG TPA: DRTGG domain-containing protein [bacterium]|nr:DRTGG domain-containing protein [bacterium]